MHANARASVRILSRVGGVVEAEAVFDDDGIGADEIRAGGVRSERGTGVRGGGVDDVGRYGAFVGGLDGAGISLTSRGGEETELAGVDAVLGGHVHGALALPIDEDLAPLGKRGGHDAVGEGLGDARGVEVHAVTLPLAARGVGEGGVDDG